jgi:hypothetical protein
MNTFNKIMSCVTAEVNAMFAKLNTLQPVVVTVDASASANVNRTQQTVSEN